MLPDTPYISVSTILLESKYSEWLEGMNKQNYSAIEELIIGTPIEQNINALVHIGLSWSQEARALV